jgi:hypothetical protein
VTIIWDDIIDGITLVEKKSPLQIDSSSYAGAPMIFGPNSLNPYDVAKETNTRGGGDQPFGPDLGVAGVDPCDVNYSGPILYYLDNGEYMITDINCDDADAGVYTINAGVVPVGDNDASLLISYYNGATEQEIEIATLTYDNPGGINSTAGQYQSTTSATFNIFAGPGYLKWQPTTPYFNLVEFKLYNISTPPDMPDCDAVYYYHYNYLSDYQKNCRVDAADLLYLLNHWVECYDPNTANCP